MIRIKIINALDYLDEAESLLASSHHAETEGHLEYAPRLNRQLYISMSKQLVCSGAFNHHELVGYCLGYTCKHQHYNIIVGNHDAFYLAPAYRKGSTALKMMALVEQEAAANGALQFFWHAKPDSTFDRILKIKYSLEERVYRKDLLCQQHQQSQQQQP